MKAKPIKGKSKAPQAPATDKKAILEFIYKCHGDLEYVRQHLVLDPSLVNATGKGETPIGAASHTAAKDIVELLLENGAELDFFAACVLPREKEVKKFLAQNPSLAKEKGEHKFTPLYFAARGKNPTVIEMLLEAGADPNDNPKWGAPPLGVAASNEDFESVKLLVGHDANINGLDFKGRTPLHLAALIGNKKIVKYLLDNDADPNIVDNDGKRASDLAADNSHQVIEKLLA